MRKNFYRQAQKGICIATLSATVLTSIPTVSYAEAYAKGRAVMEEMQKLLKVSEYPVLYAKNKRDSILLFCLDKGVSLIETNELLYEMGENVIE